MINPMKMKNTLLLAVLIVLPMFMVAQFTRQDQKAVKKYTTNLCTCTEDLVNTLNPTALQYLRIFFDDGEEKANEFLNDFVSNSTSAEVKAVNASFTDMGGESFGEKIEDCYNKDNLDKQVASDIDNMKGEAYAYFLKLIEEEETCYWLKNFYEAGIKE